MAPSPTANAEKTLWIEILMLTVSREHVPSDGLGRGARAKEVCDARWKASQGIEGRKPVLLVQPMRFCIGGRSCRGSEPLMLSVSLKAFPNLIAEAQVIDWPGMMVKEMCITRKVIQTALGTDPRSERIRERRPVHAVSPTP